MVELADRVAAGHGPRDVRLPVVAELVCELAHEMFRHMQKEEIVRSDWQEPAGRRFRDATCPPGGRRRDEGKAPASP